MKYLEKRATLSDGTIVILRSPTAEDAENALKYLEIIDTETDFLTMEPGERKLTVEQEQQWLDGQLNAPRAIQIGAFKDGVLVGMAGLGPAGSYQRVAHRAAMGIALVKDVWHLGLGTLLMREAISAAQRLHYEQLQLGVAGTNERALRLYERFGFQVYGVREKAFKYQDGHYDDEKLMALDLSV